MGTIQVFKGDGGRFMRGIGMGSAPNANDDTSQGWDEYDEWITTAGLKYTCTSASNGAATWVLHAPLPGSLAAGDLFYWTGTAMARLAIGTNAQILGINAGATAPEWEADD
jgi:hypothetical protein